MSNHLNTRMIFAGADRGLFTLPAQVTTARTAWTRLGEASIALETPPDPESVAADVAEAAVEAAAKGQPLPDVAAIIEAETTQRRHRATSGVLIDAVNRAWHQLAFALTGYADEIIVEHLRPVFDVTVDDLRDVAAQVAGLTTPHDLATAPEKARKAWLRVDGLLATYSDLGGARGDLAAFGATPALDVDGMFATMRNLEVVWPAYDRYDMANPGSRQARPWDTTDLRSTALSQLSLGADLWLPTPAEQDARWQEVVGPKVENQNRRRFELQGFAAAAGAA